MRARVIALLCLGAGVLSACKGTGEGVNAEQPLTRVSAGRTIDVPANYTDTRKALEAILKNAGYTVEVKRFSVSLGGVAQSRHEAKHKDGTKLEIRLDPRGKGTNVTISDYMEMRWGTANDVAGWLKNAQHPKLLKRLSEKVGKWMPAPP